MDEKKLIEKKIFNDTSSYQDILQEPYQQSKRHLPMNQLNRAAQFAPFGALEGFKDLINDKTKAYSLKKYSNAEQENKIIRQIEYLLVHSKMVDVNYFNDESGYYEHVKGKLSAVDWQKGRATFGEVAVVILNIREIKLI